MPGIYAVSMVMQVSLGFSLSGAVSSSGSGLGVYVPLTEEGYQSVAELRNDEEMQSFIRRLVQNGARTVSDEAGLSGFAKFYSGTVMKQDLARMKAELASPVTAWWVAEGLGKTAPLSDDGLEQVTALDDHVQVKAFLRRIVRAMDRDVEDEDMFESLAYELPCNEGAGCFRKVGALLREPEYTSEKKQLPAGELPLTEDGYQRAAALKKNDEMKVFVRRILAAEGRSVKEEAGLSGFVPFFSGVESVRDLYTLKAELRQPKHAWWIDIGIGRKAPLTEEGFKSVLMVRDNRQMKAFIRRLANPYGPMPLSEGQLSGLVPFFSGQKGTPKFSILKKELERFQKHRHHTSVGHSGYSFLQLSVDSFDVGSLAPLSESGYAEVAAYQDDAEMQMYIRRVLEAEARFVKDESGLRGLAPYYSGTAAVRSLAALKTELRDPRHAWWLANGPGKTAPLSEKGYQQVVAAHSDRQMKAYMRRAIKAAGHQITDEGALSGLVPYYSGKKGVHSLQAMRDIMA